MGNKRTLREEHRKAIAQSATQLESYIPAIADAMRAKGLLSCAELWESIKPHVAENPDFFQDVSYLSVNQAVRHERTQAYRDTDYSRTSYAIAAALDKSVEELFGELPYFKPTIKNKAEAKIAFHELEDIYQRKEALANHIENAELRCIFDEKLKTLDKRQSTAIERFFGLNEEAVSQQQIANERGFTRTYIGNIIKEGLKQLERHNAEDLRPYLHTPKF